MSIKKKKPKRDKLTHRNRNLDHEVNVSRKASETGQTFPNSAQKILDEINKCTTETIIL